jgi:hypothetical protein
LGFRRAFALLMDEAYKRGFFVAFWIAFTHEVFPACSFWEMGKYSRYTQRFWEAFLLSCQMSVLALDTHYFKDTGLGTWRSGVDEWE